MNLYIYQYNNYYNRMFKREADLEDYGEPIYSLMGCKDFVLNDCVNTQHTFGSPTTNYNGSGDYVIITDENKEILSRWFLIETKMLRNGQWNIIMRRDLVADYYNDIIGAPCFIEKATLSGDNNLIFNDEGISVNQILTDQILLKDQTKCGWFVGYYAKNTDAISGEVSVNNPNAEVFETITEPIENWKYYKYNENYPFRGELTSAKFIVNSYYLLQQTTVAGYVDKFDAVSHSSQRTAKNFNIANFYPTLRTGTSTIQSLASAIELYGSQRILKDVKNNGYFPYNNSVESDDFFKYNGKIIKSNADGEIKYYQIHIKPMDPVYREMFITSGSLYETLTSIAQEAGYTNQPNNKAFELYVTAPQYYCEIVPRLDLATRYSIPAANKLETVDSPYNIFAIPFGDITIKYMNGNVEEQFMTSAEVGERTIASILGTYGEGGAGTKIYDAQLIGYCPVNFLVTDEKEITITDELQASYIVTGSPDEPTKVGVIFNIPSSRFTTNIPVEGMVPTNKKLSSICDLYRLIAPDQSSYFDINAAKNDGIYNINIDVDLKPYNCYIHANPDFKGLYGRDFNTARGLVYGNNLSLSRALNSFTEYQIQNSQFQNIFDRQIQNMEVQHDVARTQEKWGIASGVLQGAAGGALLGQSIPNLPQGGVIGATLGAGASLWGGITDYQMNEKLRNEALDYAKDMFNFNLQNIKAQPNTLSRVSALTQNNTLFIAIEYYTCTEEEKRTIANKLAWTGMTVMTLGTIEEYMNNYWSYDNIVSKGFIKGRLVRLGDQMGEDFHLLKEIANEINKGVYF